jgi:hypothetical protein
MKSTLAAVLLITAVMCLAGNTTVAEPYILPTGGLAETLRGNHKEVVWEIIARKAPTAGSGAWCPQRC